MSKKTSPPKISISLGDRPKNTNSAMFVPRHRLAANDCNSSNGISFPSYIFVVCALPTSSILIYVVVTDFPLTFFPIALSIPALVNTAAALLFDIPEISAVVADKIAPHLSHLNNVLFAINSVLSFSVQCGSSVPHIGHLGSFESINFCGMHPTKPSYLLKSNIPIMISPILFKQIPCILC